MKKFIYLLAIILTLTLAVSAQATTITGAVEPYQSWANAAFVPTPQIDVNVINAPCPAAPEWAAACSVIGLHQIYIGSEGHNPHVFLHELGHVYDDTSMTDMARAKFMAILHTSGSWTRPLGQDAPAEQFAEAYSLCARHRTIRTFYYGMYGYTPSPQIHRRVCAVIRNP